MKKLLQSLFILLFVASSAMAQNRTITGTVTSKEDGLPLPGVSVKVKGSSVGVATGSNGKFSLSVPASATALEFSSLGFTSVTLNIGSNNVINVSLSAGSNDLSEIVVVGYGTQSKRTLTTSIARVSGEEIENQPVPSLSQAIQGRMAGVQVTSGSGRPGAPIQVNIRGRASISAGNNPLYVVDGVILPSNSGSTPVSAGSGVSALANINPDDIESIEVLKDAAAAAIYGSRGSNGVVIVSTKRGKAGSNSTISVNTYTGRQSLTNKVDLIDATQYRTLLNEARVNTGLTPTYTQAQVDNPTANVNWLDEILRDKSNVSNVQLSVASGGDQKTTYYTSLNYYNQDGALLEGSFKRYAVRLNAEHKVNSFIKLGTNISLSKADRVETPVDNSIYSPFPRAVVARPDQPIYNADGTFAVNDFNNPVHMFQSKNWVNLVNIFNSTYAEATILPELKFRSAIGIDYTLIDQRTYNPITSLSGASSNGSASSGYVQTQNYLATQTLSYLKSFFDNKLSVDATAVYEHQWNTQENNRVDGQNFPSDNTNYLTSAAQITGGTASWTKYAIESMLGRLNLGWDGKYLLGASIRRDGSSKFPKEGRYGYFPSVSAGWIASEEDFLKNNKIFSLIKLRSSYGKTGNQDGIGNFSSRRLIGTGFNYNDSPGFALSAIGSPNLKWENTKQFDVGLDLGFLNNRINFSADYYRKNTTDLLQNRPIPSTTGFGSILENIGSMKSSGFDFTINSSNFVGAFKWNTSFNISTTKNEITELYSNQPVTGSFVTRTAAVGQPMGVFFLIKSLGVNPANGNMMYQDLDGNGLINDLDRQYLGNPIPKIFGGITNNFSYKGIDLSVFFQYAAGHKIYNMSAEGLGGYESLGANINAAGTSVPTNISREAFENRWTPSNTGAKFPRAVGGTAGTLNSQRSSRYLQDGDYLRLKNITLGYNLPKSLLNKAKINNVRVYVTGQNLLTFTKYTGFDPEISSDFTVGNTGVDQGSIPQFKTIMFGINVGL